MNKKKKKQPKIKIEKPLITIANTMPTKTKLGLCPQIEKTINKTK